MKRYIYLLAVALFASYSANASSFYLNFPRQANYSVSIDGAYYRFQGSSFKLAYLGPGQHHLTIACFAPVQGQYRRPMPVVMFNGEIDMRGHRDLFASIDGYGLHIDRMVPERGPKQPSHHYNNKDRYQNREWYEEENSNEKHRYNDKNRNDEYDQRYDNRQDDGGHGQNRGGNDGNYYMSPSDFSALKYSIDNASFDHTKLTLAKSGISQNTLSIEQIREVILLFSFESTKLEIAKYAYNYTPDKDKYYQLGDAFTFDSSKNEIAQLAAR